jgi:hypothetical protein
MLVRSAQLVQELMTHLKSLEMMSYHLLLEKNAQKRLEKESVLESILLRELKA